MSPIESLISLGDSGYSEAIARYFEPADLKNTCSVSRTFRKCFNINLFWSKALIGTPGHTLQQHFLKS